MNTPLAHAIQLAGALHLLVAAANFVLPGMLRYRENLARVSPIIRHIFLVHALYIVLVLAGFAAICLLFPAELCGASSLGRFISAFLAIFWSLRVAIQICFYDRATKREHPVGNIFFTLVFLYFSAVFIAATFHHI